MQIVDPVREVRDAAKESRRQPNVLREAKEALEAEKKKNAAAVEAAKAKKSKKKLPQRPAKAKKQAPKEENLTPKLTPKPNLNPNANVGEPGMSVEAKDGGDGKLPFTIGEPPGGEEESPIILEPEAQDPVALLTNLVNGLADKMGLLIQKVSGHDQMITFAKEVLQAQGVEIPEMGGEAPKPEAAATEEGAVPKQAATAEEDPKWLVGLKTVTEFLKHAKEFAGNMGSPEEAGGTVPAGGSEGEADPFEAVGSLVERVFDIEDKISNRAAKAHEANLKALGPVIREVVESVLGATKAAAPAEE